MIQCRVVGCRVGRRSADGDDRALAADLGVASGNGKGQIFVKGQVIKTVPESEIVETLIEEAMRLAGDMAGEQDDDGVPSGSPVVTVG